LESLTLFVSGGNPGPREEFGEQPGRNSCIGYYSLLKPMLIVSNCRSSISIASSTEYFADPSHQN
jgi:hypothetical protein